MPWYRNDAPRVLGLNYRTPKPDEKSPEVSANPRTVAPGEVFEANENDIPKSYLEQKLIVTTEAPKPGDNVNREGSGQYTGPEPTQGSQTSVLESSTDKEAVDSGAYTAGSMSSDRDKRRK